MVTPKEFAVIHDVAYTTVMKWLQRDLIRGAVKEPLQPPFQGHIYWVPKDASRPESKPGPKKGSKRAVTDDQPAASPAIESPAVKPARKAGLKKGSRKAK